MNEKKSKSLDSCFKSCLYFTAGKLFRWVDRLATESFRGTGLAPTHAFLLMALSESSNQCASPGDLATTLGLDPSTITRMITFLEENEWVKREKSGRCCSIELTAAGKKLLPEIHRAWQNLYERYSNTLGEKEAKELTRTIGMIRLDRF